MSAYQGEWADTANKYSLGKESSIGVLSSVFIREMKSTTTFYLPGQSTIVISNSCNNNNHLITRAFVTDLFIKYLIFECSVWTKVG